MSDNSNLNNVDNSEEGWRSADWEQLIIAREAMEAETAAKAVTGEEKASGIASGDTSGMDSVSASGENRQDFAPLPAPEEGLTAEEAEALSEVSKKKKADMPGGFRGFLWGMVFGAVVIAAVAAVCLFIITNTYKTQIAAYRTALDTVTNGEVSLPDSVATTDLLSEEMVAKLSTIAKLYANYSVYDVNIEDLQEGLIDGMVAYSGDSYSRYYTAEELEKSMTTMQGIAFYGIGATVSIDDNGYPKIMEISDGSGAEAAGLMADDIIVTVDGIDVYGMTLDEVVGLIRGELNTTVMLNIYRPSLYDYMDVEVTRGAINNVTVYGELLDDNIGYIAISTFEEVTVSQFADALQELKDQDMKGLILDLRGNGGGLLLTAVNIATQILPEGLVVYTEGPFTGKEEYFSDGKTPLEIPMVVLVDGASASASEVLTGAIKDYGIGTIIGTKTFGKGVGQNFINLTDGSALKMTTFKYYSPKGNCIDGLGIEPDIEVEFDSERYVNSKGAEDNQLEAAIAHLMEQME